MMGIFNWISSVGAWALSGVRTLGNFSRFLFRLVVNLGPSFTRFQDTLKQLYFVGNYSLVIILVSGLFVGFVLGLQGDYVLSSYGSEQALGVLVALSLSIIQISEPTRQSLIWFCVNSFPLWK